MSGLYFNLAPPPTGTSPPVPEEEEYYSSWSLFLVCVLLILSLWTSYYLQIKKIKTVHETLVSIFAGMSVGLIVRLAPGTMIREMLVSVLILLIFLLPDKLLSGALVQIGHYSGNRRHFRNTCSAGDIIATWDG
jgi:sodium/hydrogen exchanger-like protein 6/7